MTEDNYYKIKHMLKDKLLEELKRYNEINRYTAKLLGEQDLPPIPPTPEELPAGAPAGAPAGDAAVPPPPAGPDAGLPPANMNDTQSAEEVEEVEVTDLVNNIKTLRKEFDSKKDENSAVVAKMNDVFSKLEKLETQLASMDNLISKIDELGSKVERMKPKSPEEKLEMRSLDSYPFNQNPQQFFADKQDQMRQTGKNEYVLTKDEIANYSRDTIKDTFNSELDDEDFSF